MFFLESVLEWLVFLLLLAWRFGLDCFLHFFGRLAKHCFVVLVGWLDLDVFDC